MKVYRKELAMQAVRAGYTAHYVADLQLSNQADSAGVIVVEIAKGTLTSPHTHQHLEELFIPMNRISMGVGESLLSLDTGDVVLVESGERHWFQAYSDEDARVLAIKIPNLKEDKIE